MCAERAVTADAPISGTKRESTRGPRRDRQSQTTIAVVTKTMIMKRFMAKSSGIIDCKGLIRSEDSRNFMRELGEASRTLFFFLRTCLVSVATTVG
jgi:hypothetical protein